MNISEEIIDSYLRGDLKDTELASFENAIQSDPNLQQEVTFQKEVVNTVKQYRHQQLKSRLNAIEVKPGFLSSTTSKVAASVLLLGLLIGSYYAYNTIDSDIAINSSVQQEEKVESIESTSTSSTPIEGTVALSKTTMEQQSTEASTTLTNESKKTNIVAADLKNEKKVALKKEDKITAETYAELSNTEIEEETMIGGIKEDFNMPTINTGGNIGSVSSPQIKVNIIKETTLGYRFFNNQLFLHGNFSNSTYELLELNNKPTKKLFLYFENNYYELIQGKTKVTPLSPISNEAVLLQLNQLKNH